MNIGRDEIGFLLVFIDADFRGKKERKGIHDAGSVEEVRGQCTAKGSIVSKFVLMYLTRIRNVIEALRLTLNTLNNIQLQRKSVW